MEHTSPDLLPGQKEQIPQPIEKEELDPALKRSMSAEHWQSLVRSMNLRGDVVPEQSEKDDKIEKQYELRHEHKDVSAAVGRDLGSVVTGALGEKSTGQASSSATDSTPATSRADDHSSGLPDYHDPANGTHGLLTWAIILALVVAITVLLYILF